jgi:methyl-accepting chemotaxis protein
MSFLARFRVLTKILSIVMLMAAIAAGISWLGVHALGSLNDGADEMSRASRRALTAARANQNVLVLSRSEFRAVLDPRQENRQQVRTIVDEQMKQLNDRIEDIGKTRDEQARALLPAVKESWLAYQQSMENTYRLLDGVKDAKLDEITERLHGAAVNSQAAAEKLQTNMRAVATRLSERVDDFSRAAADEYLATSRLLTIMAAVGTLLGI